METKIGIGEWKVADKRRAVVLGRQPNKSYPWVGYIEDNDGDSFTMSWDDDGFSTLNQHVWSIVRPWTSPIAPGHNPDKLTVEQVGDGWWLPEWEVLGDVRSEIKKGHFEYWCDLTDPVGWSTLYSKADNTGCSERSTYRTRLPREELLKLIAPKKRLIRVKELPPVCWVTYNSHIRTRHILVVGRDNESLLIDGRWHLIINMLKQGWQWSSDLRTWNSFEVEDKQ